MTEPKPFQTVTVERVMKAFTARKLYRRFLVADEVGLGKTVVAQRVIYEMMKRRRRAPLVVYYVSSNLAVGSQNQRKLLEVLPEDERDEAHTRVDRLALLTPACEARHPDLRLYTLTPDTSFPLRKGRANTGRKEERALLHALIQKRWPRLLRSEQLKTALKGRAAPESWNACLRRQRRQAGWTVRVSFERALRLKLGMAPGQKILAWLLKEVHSDPRVFIATMREALAASAIERTRPDLVILDEFQRYRDLLRQARVPEHKLVVGRVLGEQPGHRPAVLLLSATPYRVLPPRTEDATGTAHRTELLDLIEFLYGGDDAAKKLRKICEKAFARLAEAFHRDDDDPTATDARNQLEECLRKVIARTERPSLEMGKADLPRAPLAPEDVAVFRHLTESLQKRDPHTVVPYWTSIPLPMQAMGRQYVAWKRAKFGPASGVIGVTRQMRDRFKRPKVWPHPRLRTLMELAHPKQMIAPWIAPSAPWWDLDGPWKDENTRPRKLLVFSRFQAVPQIVSACLSYEVEATALGRQRIPYTKISKRRLLASREGRNALLALFQPSGFLIRNTDPLAAGSRNIREIRVHLRRQIRQRLRELGVDVTRRASGRPVWKILARLEQKEQDAEDTLRWAVSSSRSPRHRGRHRALGRLQADWKNEGLQKIKAIRPSALQGLVEHALAAPGVVIGRALYRHCGGQLTREGYQKCFETAWEGCRTYLDQRWFHLGLRQNRTDTYPATVQRIVIEGNLEAVLDEHLWITARLGSAAQDEGALAQSLYDAFESTSGLSHLHLLGRKRAALAMRCHVAMPFGQARVASDRRATNTQSIPTDKLRQRFNTPFWPYVLTTTSVGQEGLDFHVWCDTIVHWDLRRNAVDLEQREGRIQRFGSLAVRRAVMRLAKAKGNGRERTLWKDIGEFADGDLKDESGLQPWWSCEGVEIKRVVFDIPMSEQRHWLSWVQRQRLLYRLTLGQPNQEDLIEALSQRGVYEDGRLASLRKSVMINLSPYFAAIKVPTASPTSVDERINGVQVFSPTDQDGTASTATSLAPTP